MTGESSDAVPFQAQVELLQLFLAHRPAVVENIEGVLNAQRKPIQQIQDRQTLSLQLDDCFYTLAVVNHEQRLLKGQLERVHRASGFMPRQVEGLFNDIVNPAEILIRGFFCWSQTRWPGRKGRIRYAQTVFNVYLLRSLILLSMRLWDAGANGATERLSQLQAVLDELWITTPDDLPALVRDARWLIPLAQSPTTDQLSAYFDIAEHVAESMTESDRIETQKAAVQMIGGHLRSQIRHYCIQDRVTLNEASVIRRTRTSNALDFALLIQALVPLLEAYEQAVQGGDTGARLGLAAAVCQAISPDPELFVNRVDLLGAHSMIEELFTVSESNRPVAYTSMGQRQVRLFRSYQARIARLANALHDDCQSFRPVAGAYSPYGAIFGTPTNLIEDMALKTLQLDAMTGFSLEDVFAEVEPADNRLAWVNGWRKLPHVDEAVQKLYEYPQQYADDFFARVDHALEQRVTGNDSSAAYRTGRLVPSRRDDPDTNALSNASPITDLPVRYLRSSDHAIVAAGQAESQDEAQLLRDRAEGYFVVSFRTSGGWLAIRKDMLTEVLGAGRDVNLAGLPVAAADVLLLMCPGLVTPERG